LLDKTEKMAPKDLLVQLEELVLRGQAVQRVQQVLQELKVTMEKMD
jgi:hypothetical protein